jgi:Zn-dependent protease
MGSAFKIGRLFGIQFRLHLSWFVIFILVTFSLIFPNYQRWEYWVTGIITSLLFFASVLAHELAHSLVGRANGVTIDSITLFIFGGIAAMTGEVKTPRAEFRMAAAGPLCSLAIGIFFGLLSLVPVLPEPVSEMVLVLAVMNGMLAVFNLIPGFPMDGGRIFRAVLWHFTGSYRRSSRIAARIGQGFGYLLMLAGIAAVIVRPFGMTWFDGVWMVLVGGFLERIAAASYRQVRIYDTYAGGVLDVETSPDNPALPPDSGPGKG